MAAFQFAVGLATVAIVFGFVAAESTRGKFRMAVDECLTEKGLNPEDMRARFHGGQKTSMLEEMPEEFLCAIKCADEKLEVLKKDGTIDTSKMIFMKNLPAEEVEKMKACLEGVGKIETCQDVKKKEKCVWHKRPNPEQKN